MYPTVTRKGPRWSREGPARPFSGGLRRCLLGPPPRRKLGLEGIVSKRKDSAYRSGRSPDWLKMKNPVAPAVKREAEEDWGGVLL